MSATLYQSASPRLPAVTVTSPTARWTSRVLGGIAVLFLAVDVAMKLVTSTEAIEGTMQLGWSPHQMPTLAALQIACLALYLVPRTAPLGAVLWTGYLGGAVATHLRVGNPLFSHTLFPVYVAALLWGALYLRDDRVRALLRASR